MESSNKSALGPYFTVIVPAYNSAGYIEPTIHSILNQNFINFELIIVDDNSFDETSEIIANFAKLDQRINIITNDNNYGPNFSRNIGIKSAHGEYVIFIDSDDRLMPHALEIIFKVIDGQYFDVISFGFQFEKGKNIIKRSDLIPEVNSADSLINLFMDGQIYSVCWNKVYSLYFLKQSDILFIEDMIHGRDTIFTLECMMKASRFKSIGEIIYSSTVRDHSFSRNFSLKNVKSLILNIEEINLRLNRANSSIKGKDKYIAKHIRYSLIIASYRMTSYKSFLEAFNVLKSSGYYHTLFRNDTLINLRFFDLLVTLLIIFPRSLYLSARILKKFNVVPY
jgi:glycosyltransferase involved in cell wall biosynthesis